MAVWQAKSVTQSPWFAFLVHPRTIADLLRQGVGRFLREFSVDDAELVAKVRSMPPTVIGEVRFGFAPIYGELVCIPRLPEEMLFGAVSEWVSEAVQVATDRGARVVGLGALTSAATGGGLRLLGSVPPEIVLTNGNAFTAVTVRDNVLAACRALGLDDGATVAVVGATGSVGRLLSRLLAETGVALILIGRTAKRVHQVLPDLALYATVTADLTALRRADVIVTATHDAGARLTPAHLRRASIVVDCAQPANITDPGRAELDSAGITVVRGGLVRIPSYRSTYDFGLDDPDAVFACLAETYLFAREGLRENSVGWPTVRLASQLETAARRHAVVPVSIPDQVQKGSMRLPLRGRECDRRRHGQ